MVVDATVVDVVVGLVAVVASFEILTGSKVVGVVGFSVVVGFVVVVGFMVVVVGF